MYHTLSVLMSAFSNTTTAISISLCSHKDNSGAAAAV